MKLSVGAQQKFIGCTDAEIYGIEVVSKYSTFHSDPGLNGAESAIHPYTFFFQGCKNNATEPDYPDPS